MKAKIRLVLLLSIILIAILPHTALAKNGETEKALSQQELMHCLNLTKDEVLARYGYNFEIVRTGSEGEQAGYYYKNLGITFVYWTDGTIMRIECDKSIVINGARAGMTFDQIKEKLGEAPIKQGSIEVYYKIYILEYEIDDRRVDFSSFKDDGTNSRLAIMKKRAD